MQRKQSKKAKAKNRRAGATSPGFSPAGSWEESSSPPSFATKQEAQDHYYFAKPTINLHSHIEGLFGGGQHPIGGSHHEAALNHWQHLKPEEKTELLTVSREDVFAALKELHIASKCTIVGEPSEECAVEVAKNFLYAMEACQGRFVFPEAPSLEYIGIFVALETNLMLAFERANLLQHALMTWIYLLWRQRYIWFLGIASTVLVILLNHSYCITVRTTVQGVLERVVLSPRRWHTYVRWKSELFFVSVLAIVMAQTMRWYVVSCAITVITYLVDLVASRSTNDDDQAGMVMLRSALLWVLKIVMLLESFRTTLSLLLVSFYYFPSITVATASTAYFLVGFGLRLTSLFLPRLLPLRQRVQLAAWWNSSDGRNRAITLALAVVLVPGLTLYCTSAWESKWRRGTLRWLSLLVAANLVSLEDLQTALNAGVEGAGAIWAGLAREWAKFCGDKAKEFGGVPPDDSTTPSSQNGQGGGASQHHSDTSDGEEDGEGRRRPSEESD